MIRVERAGFQDRVAVLVVDRPKAKNALDRATIEALTLRVREVSTTARAIVLTGAGGTFVAGGDLRELATVVTREETEAFCDLGRTMCDTIEDVAIPVVAALEGYALGGGMELALACDVRVADREAKIGFVQTRMGVTTAWGTFARLVAQVGVSRATDVLLSAHVHDAEEARARGLVEHVAPPGEARSRAIAVAEELGSGAPLAVAFVKELARAKKRDEALRSLERERFVTTWLSDDHGEAVRAFFEKRPPRFGGGRDPS